MRRMSRGHRLSLIARLNSATDAPLSHHYGDYVVRTIPSSLIPYGHAIGQYPSKNGLRNVHSDSHLDLLNAIPKRRNPLELFKEGLGAPRSGDSCIDTVGGNAQETRDGSSGSNTTSYGATTASHTAKNTPYSSKILKTNRKWPPGKEREDRFLRTKRDGSLKNDGMDGHRDDHSSVYSSPRLNNLMFNLRNFKECRENAAERFMLLKSIVRDDAKKELIFTLEFSNLLLSIWRSFDDLPLENRKEYNLICRDLSKRIWSVLPGRSPGVSRAIYIATFALDLETLDEETLKPPPEQYQLMDYLIENLKPTLETSVGGTLHTFGSCSNGLWVRGSDIDFCMVIPNCKTKKQWMTKLSLVQSSLLNTDYISSINIIFARVPIAKLFDKNGVNVCDVSINNMVALRNSQYVRTMTSLDDRVIKLGRFIKYWATCRKINNRAEGTMSSYTLSLQLFYFLANRSPPVLPPFKDVEVVQSKENEEEEDEGCNFMTDVESIRSKCKYLGTNRESVVELLFAFFDYYGGARFQGGSSGATVCIYDNEVTDNDKGVLVMMCPISGKNVNPFTVKVWQSIHDEFKRFKDMISMHQPIETICQVLMHSNLKGSAERKKKNVRIMTAVLEGAKELQKSLPKNRTMYTP